MASSTRKLLVGLTAAGAVAAGFGVTAQASAEARTLSVTLLGGKVVQLTIDVPPGTPVDQIPLPDLGAPIVRVADTSAPAPVTPTEAAPATTSTEAAPAAPAPAAPAPAPTTTGTTPTPSPDATDDAPRGDDSGGQGRTEAAKERRRRQAAARKDRTDGRKVTREERKAARDEQSGREDTPADDAPDTAAEARDAGTPDPTDPTFSEVVPGPAPIGVPNYFIDKFRIPPFLLPIYQAAGIEYGIRWEVLAAINEIETDYGRNLNVSSAGALGWMQFMPATWKAYGVDANGDGKADPYNPVDAIFAAARYLKAAGGQDQIRKAIFAYNHADWYVDQVLLRARLVSGLPEDLVGSLTGLTQGVFPVAAKTQYVGDDANRRARTRTAKGKNAAKAVESGSRGAIDLFAKAGAPAIAVQDGTVVALGESKRLGRFVRLRDVYGNVYTYGNLKKLSAVHPVAKDEDRAGDAAAAATRAADAKDPVPTAAATAGEQARRDAAPRATRAREVTPAPEAPASSGPVPPAPERTPVFANPARPLAQVHGGADQLAGVDVAADDDGNYSSYLSTLHGLSKDDVRFVRLKKGSRVMAGTILGRLGETRKDEAPHLRFEIRPAGKGAPRVDPKPILDGWKLLESTTVYRAKDSSPLFRTTDGASAGQVLLMSKKQLQERVLADRNLDIYEAGRQQIRAGAIDRRVLASLEFLTANGLRVGVSSLRRPGSITSAGNVSEHDSGNAVDISSVNGQVISAKTQGAGSITEQTIRLLLQLQGTLKPHQIISLMTFEGADNTMYLPDHADHIHVGFRPSVQNDPKLGAQVAQVLKPGQWIKLIDRIADIDNPTVFEKPSKYAVRAPQPGRRSGTAGD
jgi:murein DD-endopeptidase MepM/ murein hydrolase activator NlpD